MAPTCKVCIFQQIAMPRITTATAVWPSAWIGVSEFHLLDINSTADVNLYTGQIVYRPPPPRSYYALHETLVFFSVCLFLFLFTICIPMSVCVFVPICCRTCLCLCVSIVLCLWLCLCDCGVFRVLSARLRVV